MQDAYQLELDRKEVFEKVEKTINEIDLDQPHRKEVYDIAYSQYISPRLSKSPNSSFATIG